MLAIWILTLECSDGCDRARLGLASLDLHNRIQRALLGRGERLGELDALPGLGGERGVAVGSPEVHAALVNGVTQDVVHVSWQL